NGPGSGVRASGAGAASTITWTLVPEKPNPLIPAQRGPAGHGVDSTGTRRLAGIRSRPTASTALIRLAMPAAPSECPRLVLTEPTQSGLGRARPKTRS